MFSGILFHSLNDMLVYSKCVICEIYEKVFRCETATNTTEEIFELQHLKQGTSSLNDKLIITSLSTLVNTFFNFFQNFFLRRG